MKKILLLSNVNIKSPAVRYRMIYTLDELVKENKISYEFKHFYSERTSKAMDGKNQFAKIIYVILDIFKFITEIKAKKENYHAVIVKNYVFPFGGANFERKLLSSLSYNNIFYDIDDAIYLNKSRAQNKLFSKFRNAAEKVEFWSKVANKVFVSNKIIKQDLKDLFEINEEKFNEFLSCPYRNQYFSKKEEVLKSKSFDAVNFIWLGSPHTQVNLSMCLDFIKELPKVVNNPRVIMMGCTKDFELFKGLDYVELVEWSEANELKHMREAHFGLNPLYNDEFELRKSAFKVIQYYRAGIIPIVSDVGINQEITNTYGGYCTTSFKMDGDLKVFIEDSLKKFKETSLNIYNKSTVLSVESNKEIIENAIFEQSRK